MLRIANLRHPHRMLLVLALIFSFTLRLIGVFEKGTITFDESISYLAATGHQSEMARIGNQDIVNKLAGVWARAAEWKRLISPERSFVFGEISFGLARYDVHPPLYFWCLHIWLLVTGVASWSGPLLNILLAVPNTIAVFLLGRYIFGRTEQARIATAVWVLSPAVIASAWFARMYELYSLLTVLLVWQVARLSDIHTRLKVRGLLLLTLISLGGLLTHNLFAFVVVLPAVFFLVLRLATRDRWRLILILGTMILAIFLLWALHPDFYLSFREQQRQIQERFTLPQLGERLGHLLRAGLGFFVPYSFLKTMPDSIVYYASLIPYTALVWITAVDRRFLRHRIIWGFRRQNGSRDFVAVFFVVTMLGVLSVLYLSFTLAVQQVWEYKTSMIWPFIAMSLVLLFETPSLARHGQVLLYTLYGLLLLSSVAATLDFVATSKLSSEVSKSLAEAENIIIDNRQRGVILPLVWHIPDDKPVFVGMQQEFLQLGDLWIHKIRRGTVFVHNPLFHDKDYLQEIASRAYPYLTASGYKIRKLQDTWEGYGFYMIE